MRLLVRFASQIQIIAAAAIIVSLISLGFLNALLNKMPWCSGLHSFSAQPAVCSCLSSPPGTHLPFIMLYYQRLAGAKTRATWAG
jgi:hypothetical protein